jgi:hypothetical protein
MVGVDTVLALMRRGVIVLSIEVALLLSGLRYLVGVCASYGLRNSCADWRAGEMGAAAPSSSSATEAGVEKRADGTTPLAFPTLMAPSSFGGPTFLRVTSSRLGAMGMSRPLDSKDELRGDRQECKISKVIFAIIQSKMVN